MTVTDFRPGEDIIQIDHSLFGNAKAVVAKGVMQNDGHGNTVITYDTNDTITLLGVTTAQLHLTDFHIV
ncbi:hypothetical protein [Bradyrhizobium liaoningense]|uniref:hypothetical protein n=1 Tax=Bradyrhizobium liaoningense TaxID=43992 RepID=UPI00054EFBC4|nr:hypothetical protein [Bradyrhizobium liaoningense]